MNYDPRVLPKRHAEPQRQWHLDASKEPEAVYLLFARSWAARAAKKATGGIRQRRFFFLSKIPAANVNVRYAFFYSVVFWVWGFYLVSSDLLPPRSTHMLCNLISRCCCCHNDLMVVARSKTRSLVVKRQMDTFSQCLGGWYFNNAVQFLTQEMYYHLSVLYNSEWCGSKISYVDEVYVIVPHRWYLKSVCCRT